MADIIRLKPEKTTVGGAEPLTARNPNRSLIAIEKNNKKFNKILKQAKKTGASIDLDELKAMRRTVRVLIPEAAKSFAIFKNDRNAMALNILINQQRELISDIRSLDLGPRQIEHIMEKILQPLLQSVMQNYMGTNHEIKSNLRKIKDQKIRDRLMKHLDTSLEQQGQFFNVLQNGIREKITEYLLGKSR